MRKHFLRLLATGLFVFTATTGFTQQIDSMMGVYAERFPTEKIHIHFDKSVYNKEETIWYKIYLLSGTELSSLSKNVYVEWYDTTGKMIKQTVSPLYQSTAKGAFEIPADYKGNFLHVKAYTRWMLNDDPAVAYEKELTVNTGAVKTVPKPVVMKTQVETFPEGGFLIQGLLTRVAFKATNQYGTPVFIKGILVNDQNVVLDTLKVKHDGMGSFYLRPSPQETYKLNWTDENGKTGSTPITNIKTEGVNISVKTTNDKALIQVQRTPNVPEDFKRMNLLVHMNQTLFYKVKINASEKTSLSAEVPIEELPTGILQISLFTSDWIPISERIVFINNHLHEFNAKLTTPVVSLDKRGKNIFEIYVSDSAFTNMSIAVTDATLSTLDVNTIYSDMLLSNDIKGKVYNPGYYLISDADSVTANLDLVMLTNGWRRFDWDKIKAGITPTLKYPRETEFMKLGGKVLGLKSFTTATPIMLNMIVVAKDSSKNFFFVPVAKDGSFEQKGALFFDTSKIFYSFNGNSKLSEITQVQFDNGLLRQELKKIQYTDTYRPYAWSDSLARAKMNYLLTEQELLKKRMASATLQEVIVKTRAKSKEQILDEKYSTGLFSGGDATPFDLTDDPAALGSLDILSYLQGRVAGLTITGSGSSATMSWRGSTPEIFVNEMRSDIDQVVNIPVTDIALVKVFRPPFFGASGGGAGGAIAIYTKKGVDATKGNANSKGLDNTILGGYSRFKEFYNPSYEKPNDNGEIDSRTTLYWNPYVITNKKSSRVRLQFYNNDISKKLQVVLEGINADGKMTRVVKLLE